MRNAAESGGEVWCASLAEGTKERGQSKALRDERELVSAILGTVEALILVLDSTGRILRFNRACEELTGYSSHGVNGQCIWDLLLQPDEGNRFRTAFDQALLQPSRHEFESCWAMRDGSRRWIAWSLKSLALRGRAVRWVVATGIDRTERKRLENTILEISGREQRRIGQDLHDGLGQHLTGIAFLTKVHERALAEKSLPEAADAAKIVNLVNDAINKARELARGLMPVLSESHGLMEALQQWAAEVGDLFHVTCRFECDDPVSIADDNVANHLYRIAQEAVHNAIKHGRPSNITIGLRAGEDEGALTVRDDGCGLPAVFPNQTGMGFSIMSYRAAMIGGTLHTQRVNAHGTQITCVFPVPKRGRPQ